MSNATGQRGRGRQGRRGGRRAAWAAGALGVGLALGAGSARAGEAVLNDQELTEQVRQLRQRVETLRDGQRADAKLTAEQVDRLLRDADRRSQLLVADREGFTAGYTNNKFILQSADGNFVLNPNFQFQLRFVANSADSATADGGDDNVESGLEVRRLKMSFDGNAFGPNTAYKFQWQTSRNGGAVILEDAWVRHKFADRWQVRAGQFVEPLVREQLVSSRRQLTVDRSLLSELLGGTGGESYVQGVTLIYDNGDNLRAEGGYIDGIQSQNTNFVDGGGVPGLGITAPDFGVVGRVEYKAFGDWKQYDDFTARGNDKGLLVFGLAADYTEAGDNSALFHTFDIHWEPAQVQGLSLYGAYLGVYREFGTAPGLDASPYDWGFLAQAGYMINDKWEVFGRYDYIDLDEDAGGGTLASAAAASGSDDIHEITAGVNYFIQGHAAKITVDGTWLPNGSPVNATGVGVLAQDEDDDQFILRAQFQLLI